MPNNIIKIDQNQEDIVDKASKILKNGSVLVLPFDTVYGLCADAGNNDAVRKIFNLKKRNLSKPIGVAVDSIDGIEKIALIDDKSKQLIENKIPGKYTFILKAESDNGVSKLCQKDNTIGVRVPDSDLILSITKQSGLVLAQTSANIAGGGNVTSAQELMEQFGDNIEQIDLIIDGGKLECPVPSEIIDMTGVKPKRVERD